MPPKNIPSLGAAPSKLAGTLVFHPSCIDNHSVFTSSDIEFSAAWSRRRCADGGLSHDEAFDVHLEALHSLAVCAGNRQPSRDAIRSATDAVLVSRSSSFFIRSSVAALEEAWLALRRSLESREAWVLSVKQGGGDASVFKSFKAAADAATAASAVLGAKGVYQAVRWHFLHGQTESREFQLWQARELYLQQQQQQLQQQQQQQQRHLASKLAKHRQTLYAKRPAFSKMLRPAASHKKTPPAPAPCASAGGGSDSDIIDIPSPPDASAVADAAHEIRNSAQKRPSPSSKVSPCKKCAAASALVVFFLFIASLLIIHLITWSQIDRVLFIRLLSCRYPGYGAIDEEPKNKDEEEVRLPVTMLIFCTICALGVFVHFCSCLRRVVAVAVCLSAIRRWI